ncbi:MAG: pknD 3 [Conexibacter sp.]|nr:pknD 3 [Conexibacter sp.]
MLEYTAMRIARTLLPLLALAACAGLPASASATISLVAQFGGAGAGDGQIGTVTAPSTGIATDRAGNVYVADSGNHRIEVFSPGGAFLRTFGSVGTGDGQFSAATSGYGDGPDDVAVDLHGNVYVADVNRGLIQVFDPTGAFVRKWGGAGGTDQLTGPRSVAIGPDGQVYVADVRLNRIKVYAPDGTFLRKWGTTGNDPGQIQSMSIDKLNVDAAGNVYLLEGDRIVQKYTSEGVFVTQWSTVRDDSTSNYPKDVAVDAGQHVLIADDEPNSTLTTESRVLAYATDGTYAYKFDERLGYQGPDATGVPIGLGADCLGNTYVLDSTGHIRKYHDDTAPARCALVVNDTGDGHDVAPGDGSCATPAGACTLRAAIEEADAQGQTSASDITFNLPTGAAAQITPATSLPAITVPVSIDGATQPGTTGRQGVLLGAIGAQLAGVNGLDVEGGKSTINALAVAGFGGFGIKLGGAGGDAVRQSVVRGDGVGIEVAAPGETLSGISVFGNGSPDAATAFEGSLKGRTATPAEAQQGLLATGGGIVARTGAAKDLFVKGSAIGSALSGDGTAPAAVNQAIGILLAPGDGALSGVRIGDGFSTNTVTGNALGVVLSSAGPAVQGPAIVNTHFGADTGGGPLSPLANGVGLLLTGNVAGAQVGDVQTGNSFEDSAVGLMALGQGVTGLHVEGNTIGADKTLSDLVAQISGGHPSLGQHNLLGVVLGDVSGAQVTGNAIYGNALGLLMSGTSSSFNTISNNRLGLSTAPGARLNALKLGDFGSALGIVASLGHDNHIGIAGSGNTVRGALLGALVSGEKGDAVQSNILDGNLYGLTLDGVDGTTVGDTNEGGANFLQHNWIGVLQSQRELTDAEQKTAKLDTAAADASDRKLAFATPYSQDPLNIADALTTADVDESSVTVEQRIDAAKAAQVRYGHNYIGTDAGDDHQGNYLGMGFVGDVRRTIVGVGGGGPNTIAHNHLAGIGLFGSGGHWPMGVSLLGNSIHDNSSLSTPDPLIPGTPGLGIDLGTPIAVPTVPSQVYGPTPNDPLDADTGPNGLQNYPVLVEAARSPRLSFRGTLETAPEKTYNVEISSSPFCNPYGYGEGEHVLQVLKMKTDETGVVNFAAEEAGLSGGKAPPPRLPAHDRYLTATATAPDGSTSEYSACAKIAEKAPPLSIAPGDTGVSASGATSVQAFNADAYDVREVRLETEQPLKGRKSDVAAGTAKAKVKRVLLARTKLKLKPKHSKRVTLHLTAAARKLLASKKQLTVIATVTSRKGAHHHTATVRYVVHAPPAKKATKKPKAKKRKKK